MVLLAVFGGSWVFELLARRLAGDECFLLVLFSASIIVCSFPTLNLFLPSDLWLLWAVCAGNGDWEVGEISQQYNIIKQL